MTEKQNETLTLVDIQVTRDSMNFIKSQADEAMRNGKYGFDDAQKIIISVNNVMTALDTLDKLQILALQLKQRQDQANTNIDEVTS